MNKPLIVLASFSEDTNTTFRFIHINTVSSQRINLFETTSFDFSLVIAKVYPNLPTQLPISQWLFKDITECFAVYSKYLMNLVEYSHANIYDENNISRFSIYFPNKITHAKILNTYFEHYRK